MWSQGPLSGWGPTLVFPQAQPEPTELRSRDAEGKTEVPFFFSGQMSPGLSLTDISVWVSPDLVQTWRLPFHLCALLAVPSSPSPLLSIGAAPSCPLFLATHSTFPCCFSPFILSILTALAPDLISHLDNFRIDQSSVLGDKCHTGLGASRTCRLERHQCFTWVGRPRRAAGSRSGGQPEWWTARSGGRPGEILVWQRHTGQFWKQRERNDYLTFQAQTFHFLERKEIFWNSSC